jgi:neurofibromin 1
VVSDNPLQVPWAMVLTSTDARLSDALMVVLRDAGPQADHREALVRRAIDYEVANTVQPQQLFRAGSPSTRLMASLYRMESVNFLATLVLPLYEDAAKITRSVEIDASRASELSPKEFTANVAEIEAISSRLLERIWASAPQFPYCLTTVLEHARMTAEIKFPVAHGGMIAVIGLLFLRFIVPAITSPELFGLATQEISQEAHRGLIIVSKVVQTVANGMPIEGPDNFMAPLNPLISRNFDSCKKYILAVSVCSSSSSSHIHTLEGKSA